MNGGTELVLDYEDMPYELLIDKDGKKWKVNNYCVDIGDDTYGLFGDRGNQHDDWIDVLNFLKSLTLQNWTNKNVTNMSNMFYVCYILTSLTLGDKFDTSNVTNMSNMFYECKQLTSLTLGDKFDTSSVTEMSDMFGVCSALTSLDLSNFNTSSVTDMSRMFSGCSALTSLDLSNFDTSRATTMYVMFAMFSGCSALTTLTLGENFVVPSTYNSSEMQLAPSSVCKITMNNTMYTVFKQYDLNAYTFSPDSWNTEGGAVQEITVTPPPSSN